MRPVAFGALAGITGELAVAQILRSELFETAPLDPLVFTAALVILLAFGLAAAAIPAWRAMRIDPLEVLRAE
jgi:ABC-type lipoprotein release transport system permease subunit